MTKHLLGFVLLIAALASIMVQHLSAAPPDAEALFQNAGFEETTPDTGGSFDPSKWGVCEGKTVIGTAQVTEEKPELVRVVGAEQGVVPYEGNRASGVPTLSSSATIMLFGRASWQRKTVCNRPRGTVLVWSMWMRQEPFINGKGAEVGDCRCGVHLVKSCPASAGRGACIGVGTGACIRADTEVCPCRILELRDGCLRGVFNWKRSFAFLNASRWAAL